ncbi:MAG: hypothetical protein ACYDBB_19885 [Armatimonadota bacterium]
MKTSVMMFEFLEQGSHAAILHDGREIIEFNKNLVYFAGSWWAQNQCMVPGEGQEVASLPIFASFDGHHLVSDVRYEAQCGPDSCCIKITPTRTIGGTKIFNEVTEQCTLTVRLVDGRYEWEQQLDVQYHRDIDTSDPAANERLRFYHFPRQNGEPGIFLQYADPQQVGASGPAVPMTHDWLGQPEPMVGPDSFRKNWQRRYTSIIFQNPDGSFSWSDLNKTKWHRLTMDNRRARPCHPQGLLYVAKEDGSAIEYRTDAPSHYHHVCEWGMDFHFWMDLQPFMHGTVIPAGTTLTCKTTARLVDPEVTRPIFTQAQEIMLTERERFIADRPAYEEPENTFTVSGLERLDAQVWQPTSEGCRWEKTGGYCNGAGCLVIQNNYSNIGAWRQTSLGPSQWGNPLLMGARYRLSAWVKVEHCECDTTEAGPMIGVEFGQYNGPAVRSPRVPVDGGWSQPLISVTKPVPTQINWTYLEVITPPCPSYALVNSLILRFHGRGIAYFSNVRWEMVEE